MRGVRCDLAESRVLFCSTELSPLYPCGGVGTFLLEAARALADNGHFAVDLLCDRDRYPPEAWSEAAQSLARSGITLYGYSGHIAAASDGESDHPWARRSEAVRRSLCTLHRRHPYALIEFAEWGAEGAATLWAKADFPRPRPRFIVRLHSPSIEIAAANGETIGQELIRADALEKNCIRLADIVLSPSRFLLDWARSQDLLSSAKVMRSPYPYSLLKADPGSSDAPPRPKNGRCPTIVYFGRLELRKGVVELAEAVKRLHNSARPDAAFETVFIGADTHRAPPPHRSMRSFLESELGAMRSCVFMSDMPRDALLEWLDTHADIIVVPSRWDNYPNVILEAAQLNCDLVVSDAGGIRELLADYRIAAAAVFRHGSAGALADALGHVMADGSARYKPTARMRRHGARVRSEFVELYRALCAAGTSAAARVAP